MNILFKKPLALEINTLFKRVIDLLHLGCLQMTWAPGKFEHDNRCFS